MAERNIRLLVEYQGRNFAGWQIQSGQSTIQGEIAKAIERVTGEKVNLIGAGRTDAGVHARGQTANFLIDHSLSTGKYCDAINYYLPDGILIKKAQEVAIDFHSRHDATRRRYRYLVSNERSAIYCRLRWEQPQALDFGLLSGAAAAIVGDRDFTPFCVVSSLKENNCCRISYSRWRRVGPLLVYEIIGNRFLHSMVRSLVGGMVNLATVQQDKNQRNLTLDHFRDMLSLSVRERNLFTAPAHGLYLVSVAYDKT